MNLGNNGFGITEAQACEGRIPIWLDPEEAKNRTLYSGFTLANPPLAPAVVPVATPINVDEATRLANICYRFEVYEEASDSDVEIKIVKDSYKYGTLAKVGMNIMAQPATTTTAGAAYPITDIDVSNVDYDVITLETTLGETLVVGRVLAEADSTHATTAKLLYVTQYVMYASAYVSETKTGFSYSVAATFGGQLYNRRIRKIDATEMLLLPQIKFTELK